MALLTFPDELLVLIAMNLSTFSDLNGFVRTSHRLYCLLNDYLYRIDVQRGGSRALLWAAEHGLGKTAELSLAEGADCEATGRATRRSVCIPLRISNRRSPIRKFHFDEQTLTFSQCFASLTPLQCAIDHKHEIVTRLLIEYGADVKKRYPVHMAKCTPLHLASANGLTATVKLLLDTGAKLECKDAQGQTPLHYAVKANQNRPRGRGSIRTVICLLEYGARYGTRDRSGRQPKDLVDSLYWESGQEREEDRRAEKAIKRLLEAKEAQRIVERWDKDRGSLRKKRIAAEKVHVSRDKTVNTKSAWLFNDCFGDKPLRKEMKEEVKHVAEKMKATENTAGDARTLDVSVRERQDAARKSWSQLRERAEQTAGTREYGSTIISCAHSSIGWLRNKGRAQCRLCEKICPKYSFLCPDCQSVVCMRCKAAQAAS